MSATSGSSGLQHDGAGSLARHGGVVAANLQGPGVGTVGAALIDGTER
jgi:hypothetical protein